MADRDSRTSVCRSRPLKTVGCADRLARVWHGGSTRRSRLGRHWPRPPPHELALSIACQAPPEEECVTGATLHEAWAAMYGATATLSDTSPPTLTAPVGELWEPGAANGYHKGTESVAVEADDVGGGGEASRDSARRRAASPSRSFALETHARRREPPQLGPCAESTPAFCVRCPPRSRTLESGAPSAGRGHTRSQAPPRAARERSHDPNHQNPRASVPIAYTDVRRFGFDRSGPLRPVVRFCRNFGVGVDRSTTAASRPSRFFVE